MINFYCTLFDSNYLSRGLVMYDSLLKHSGEFQIYIFAFDELCYRILSDLNLKNATIISLKEFETTELKEVKKTRTKGEYCWTCTPATIRYVLEKFKADHCTYIDSDLVFYSDPSVLTKELDYKRKSVLITLHRYSFFPRIYSEKRSGKFCVQYVTFKNEPESLAVLTNWHSQCIDWCYARYEDGKFGDQKYLDAWPSRYSNIHILENEGGGVAPWNAGKYHFSQDGIHITGRRKRVKNEFKIVFYHFQYVKFLEEGQVDTGWYIIPEEVKKIFYFPYLSEIKKIERMLSLRFADYKPTKTKLNTRGIKGILKSKLHYNIISYNGSYS